MSSGWVPVGSQPRRPEPPAAHERSLVELLREGDRDAQAGFHDAHIEAVRSYCSSICAPEDVEAACDAAFVDFTGRLAVSTDPDPDLEVVLAAATRAAAAARYAHDRESSATCITVPELLAARANHELEHSESLGAHIAECPICRETEAKMENAESAFGGGEGRAAAFASSVPERLAEPEPQAVEPEHQAAATEPQSESEPQAEIEPQSQAEPESEPQAPVEPEPDAEAEAGPEPEAAPPAAPSPPAPSPPPPRRTVRRSGGLVGAARSLARDLRGKSGS